MIRGASLEGHLNITPGGPLRVNDGEGFALGMVESVATRACGAANRGEMVLLRGSGGTDDATYRCTYDGTSAYAWIAVTDTTTGDARYVKIGTDPNADRIYFWDDSAGAPAFLTPDATDLAITDATLALGSAPSFSDFTNAQHDHLDADDGGTLTINALSDVGGITAILTNTAAWNPGNLANLSFDAVNVTCTGAAVGDPALAGFSSLVTGWLIYATVIATDSVRVTIENRTGGSVDLASGTVRVTVFKY
jgi:hypothetical protein